MSGVGGDALTSYVDRRTDGQTDRQTDRQGDSYIPPQTMFAGGIKKYTVGKTISMCTFAHIKTSKYGNIYQGTKNNAVTLKT